MRRINRIDLTPRTNAYLARKQHEVDGGRNCRKVWDNARKTKAFAAVSESLKRMSGQRQRCMFCEDSRGTQIDHFWPIAVYPGKTFVWENLLWVCGGCNLIKGSRLDIDGQGQPLLIDPTAEDPWDYLFFDPDTGILTARFLAESGYTHPKGEYTTRDDILPLNIEVVTESRRRVYRCLRRAVQKFLAGVGDNRNPDALQAELLDDIRDHDDFGLVHWHFCRDGSNLPPFSVLRKQHPAVWQQIVASLAK